MRKITNMLLFSITAFLMYMEGIRSCTCDVSHMTMTAFTVYVNAGSPGNTSGSFAATPTLTVYPY